MMILMILMIVTTVFIATAYNEVRSRKAALARSRRYWLMKTTKIPWRKSLNSFLESYWKTTEATDSKSVASFFL